MVFLFSLVERTMNYAAKPSPCFSQSPIKHDIYDQICHQIIKGTSIYSGRSRWMAKKCSNKEKDTANSELLTGLLTTNGRANPKKSKS